jgi:hypothetical protein
MTRWMSPCSEADLSGTLGLFSPPPQGTDDIITWTTVASSKLSLFPSTSPCVVHVYSGQWIMNSYKEKKSRLFCTTSFFVFLFVNNWVDLPATLLYSLRLNHSSSLQQKLTITINRYVCSQGKMGVCSMKDPFMLMCISVDLDLNRCPAICEWEQERNELLM